MTAPHLLSPKPISLAAPVNKSWSVADVLAAGGPHEFILNGGIDPKQVRLSGVVRLSRTETDALQAQLREQL